jgi:sulfur carrier protein ThiS adenylyltransferase
MTAEVVRVLASERPAVDGYYATTLFRPEQAFVGACTSKSTIYSGSIAGGLMLSQFTRWLRGMPLDRDVTLNLLGAELVLA